MQENTAPEEATDALSEQTDALPAESDDQEPMLLDEADNEMLAAAPEQEPLLIDAAEEASAEEICEPMSAPDFPAVSDCLLYTSRCV